LFSKNEVGSLLTDNYSSIIQNPGNHDFFLSMLGDANSRDNLERNIALLDIVGYLPEYQLTYMDRMSMATGLEVRSPFCDYRLVEYAHSLPPAYRLQDNVSKYILKLVAQKHLPQKIIHRKKVGFDSPIGEWFKTELSGFLKNFLAAKEIDRTGILNPQAVRDLVASHDTGKRDFSLHIWSIVALEMWYRMYFEMPADDINSCTIADIRGGN